MKSCTNCPHLRRKEFDGLPYWRCNRPNVPQPDKRCKRGRPNDLGQAAVEWLKEYLKDGPKPSGNKHDKEPQGLFGAAFAAGFTYATIQRVSQILGVRKEKVDRRWFWSLPEERLSDSDREALQ